MRFIAFKTDSKQSNGVLYSNPHYTLCTEGFIIVNSLGKDRPGVALSGHRILLADHPLKLDIAGGGARCLQLSLQLRHQVSDCSEE